MKSRPRSRKKSKTRRIGKKRKETKKTKKIERIKKIGLEFKHPKLYLYNTLKRKKQLFKPIKKDIVGIYSCGPTVYWYQHIGNMRTYIFSDILKRVLTYNGYTIRHVMNITDVGHLTSDADTGEDKMIQALKRENLPLTKESMLKLAKKYTNIFKQDLQKLNITEPDVWPKATEHIKEMITLIERMEKRGYTYLGKNGNVYFNTSKFKNYTKLANLKLEDQKAGVSVEIDKEKKNPRDFVLWFSDKGSKFRGHIFKWQSPWGEGWPGWHIECSAMSMAYLGENFDIHTGGEDHIQIHHTNEIAQSEAATGKKVVNYWLHARWLLFKEEKMAKSEGNIFTISALENKGYNPLTYRYFCLTAHYRTQLEFSWQNLDAAQNAFNSLKKRILEIKQNLEVRQISSDRISKYKKEFEKVINDDLNMPKALALLWKVVKDNNLKNNEKYSLILIFDKIFALDLDKVKEEKIKIPEKISQLIKQREQARKNKNFPIADKLREQIKQQGYTIEDTSEGTKVKPLQNITKK